MKYIYNVKNFLNTIKIYIYALKHFQLFTFKNKEGDLISTIITILQFTFYQTHETKYKRVIQCCNNGHTSFIYNNSKVF